MRSTRSTTDASIVLDRETRGNTPDPFAGMASLGYLLAPDILRQIKAIDSALDVEWRPRGEWWTSFVEYRGQRPVGATPGCWRVVLIGKSGKRKGLRLWPPHLLADLPDYLRHHWGFRHRNPRRYAAETAAVNPDLRKKQEHADFLDRWGQTDHYEMWRAVRKHHEPPKWRALHAVHKDTPVGGS